MTSRRPRRPRRLRALSLTRLTPNIVTVLALCAGITAIRFAIEARWQAAVAAIVIAALLDASDGRLARMLGASSRFGAELDSLSDVISFGVAPALILYIWTMNGAGALGWAISLLYIVCIALRLARFNTALDEDKPIWGNRFFTGLSSPVGAGLVLLPIILSFQFQGDTIFNSVWLNAIVLIVVSVLLVSRVPTYSFKSVRVPPRAVLPLLVIISALAAFLVGAPWATLSAVGLAYAASVPFSVMSYKRLARSHNAHVPRAGETVLDDSDIQIEDREQD